MRLLSLTMILLVGLVASAPALAGKVSYADGKGQWVPTTCGTLQAPVVNNGDPETPANDMNARVTAHNAFVAAADAYMACVSKEAQNDAEAFGQLITNSAQDLINQTQRDVADSAARANAKPATR